MVSNGLYSTHTAFHETYIEFHCFHILLKNIFKSQTMLINLELGTHSVDFQQNSYNYTLFRIVFRSLRSSMFEELLLHINPLI